MYTPAALRFPGYAFGVSAGLALVYLDRQFQREPFSGPCFFAHGTSSRLACCLLLVCE